MDERMMRNKISKGDYQRRAVTSAIKIIGPISRQNTKKFQQQQRSATTCACLCWREIVALKRLIQEMRKEIDRHSGIILEFEELKNAQMQDYDLSSFELAKENSIENEETDEMCWISDASESDSQKDVANAEFDEDNDSRSITENSVLVMSTVLGEPVPSSSSLTAAFFPQAEKLDNLQFANIKDEAIKRTATDNSQDFQLEPIICTPELEHVLPVNKSMEDGTKPRTIKRTTKLSFSKKSLSHDSTLVCSYCTTGHIYKDKTSLRKHIQHFHTDARTLFVCNLCNKSFDYREGLAYHQRSVHYGIRYHCGESDCDYAYSTITRLRRHKRVAEHHAPHKVISLSSTGPNKCYRRRKVIDDKTDF